MTALLLALLPTVAGLIMLWAGLVALAGEGDTELGARALARDPGTDDLPPARILHVIHLASLTAAAAVAGTAVAWWAYPPAIALVRVMLVTVLVWTVGDLAPRLLATLAPELVPHARQIALAARPLFAPLLWMAARLDRSRSDTSRLGARPDGHSPQQMALGVFSLAEMGVAEVMTPRLDIIAVQVSESEAEVVATMRRSEHARLLVFDGHPDAVVGVIYAKDVLPRLFAIETLRDAWQTLIRPAAFVPTGKTLDRQLRDFQRGPGHLAVVVDEFGGTAGIVTLEDILEQIVGEIQDEHDVDEVQPLQRIDDGHLVVEGGVPLADLEAELEHDFDREDVATVGGLVLATLGRVPRSGESIEIDGWRVEVELVVRRRIRRVAFWPAAPVGLGPSKDGDE
ncbi:MAG: hemolysin family protein [Gemmatimonadota bacterium]